MIDLSALKLNISEADKKRPLVFFEAHEYAKSHLNEWEESGIIPVCFADKDETKYGTEFCGYKVYSLEEAISLYPQALIVIANGNKFITAEVKYLAERVNPELIRHPMETYYGFGCSYLGSIYDFYGDNLICCFGKTFRIPNITTFEPWDKLFLTFSDFTKSVIQKLDKEESNACSGCKELYQGFWVTNPEVNYLIFDSGFQGAKCNYKCPYCSHPYLFNAEKDRYDHLVPSEFLRYFWENHKNLGIKVNYANFNVSIAIAEPVLLPDLEKLLGYIDSVKEINPLFLTNASIYSEVWADILSRDKKARMVVDISAGTVETYKKNKGVTCLDKVIDNLEKYVKSAISPNNITIKYIFFDGANDNYDDVNGFLEIAKRIKCKVEISNDLFTKLETTEKIKELFIYLINELKKNNILFELNSCQAAAFYDVEVE